MVWKPITPTGEDLNDIPYLAVLQEGSPFVQNSLGYDLGSG